MYFILLDYIIVYQIVIVISVKMESTQVHFSKTNSKIYPYHLKTTAFGIRHHMKLRKLPKLESEVFSPNFQMQTHFISPENNTMSFKTAPISKIFLKSLSENIFMDPKFPGSHISITKNFANGEYVFQGFLAHDKTIKPGLFGNHTIVHHVQEETKNVSSRNN